MLNLPLDPTDDRAKPAFKDAVSCAKWIAQLQLTNLHQAHGVVRAQLDEFNRYPMRGLERLRTLELLRETVAHLQTDYARKLTARKLPLNEEEFTILVCITALWQLMVNGYQRCLQSLLAGDKQLGAYGPMLCQRCLLYTDWQVSECLRNGYEFEGKLWQQLHTIYAFCEQQGWQAEPVSLFKELHSLYGISEKEASKLNDLTDGLNSSTVPCHTLYVKTLLSCQAYPGALSRSQALLLERWLLRWSATIPLERHYTVSKGDAPPLAVDLASSRGLQSLHQLTAAQLQASADDSGLRYLPMLPLSKLLRVKTILLQQGQSPQQLELEEGQSSADCIELLTYLHSRWCDTSGAPDTMQRGKQARIGYGLEDIYSLITDKPFKTRARDIGSDTLARKQIATFGRVLAEDNRPAGDSVALEIWQITNENMLGAQLLRDGTGGTRVGLNQIVAVRGADSEATLLGSISWVQVTLTGQLSAGIRYLPGLPQAITVKGTGIHSNTGKNMAAAVLLPAVTTLNIPSSLILPRDWFAVGRVIEVISDKHTLKVKLNLSIENGLDYERVSFTAV